MSVEPTPAQLAALRDGDPAERIALVRLLRAKERGAYDRYGAALDAAVAAAGGRRSFRGAVDAVLTGGGAFDELWIDEFPSRELAAESLRSANPHAASALADAVVLAVRPRRVPAFALRVAGLWQRLRHGSRAKHPGALPTDTGNRAIDPAPEEIGAFLTKEPARPLYILNLNEHRERGAYRRYGENTLPHILRRGGGPLFVAAAASLVVGDAAHPLAPPWDEVLLVHYPARATMLDMLCDPDYQRGLPHREQGLVRAGLVATSR